MILEVAGIQKLIKNPYFSSLIFALIFGRLFGRKMDQKWFQKLSGDIHFSLPKSTLAPKANFRSILVALSVPCGTLWLSFRTLWLLFGSLLTFIGFILAPFWVLCGLFCVFLACVWLPLALFCRSFVSILLLTAPSVKILQKNRFYKASVAAKHPFVHFC